MEHTGRYNGILCWIWRSQPVYEPYQLETTQIGAKMSQTHALREPINAMADDFTLCGIVVTTKTKLVIKNDSTCYNCQRCLVGDEKACSAVKVASRKKFATDYPSQKMYTTEGETFT